MFRSDIGGGGVAVARYTPADDLSSRPGQLRPVITEPIGNYMPVRDLIADGLKGVTAVDELRSQIPLVQLVSDLVLPAHWGSMFFQMSELPPADARFLSRRLKNSSMFLFGLSRSG